MSLELPEDFEQWVHSAEPENYYDDLKENSNKKFKFVVVGQVVHRRKVSKKLFFFDLRVIRNCKSEADDRVDSESSMTSSLKLEVIVRFDEVALDLVAALWRKVHVGDKVRIQGWVEVTRSPTLEKSMVLFHCLVLETLERYSGQHPFEPEPPGMAFRSRDGSGEGKAETICKYWLNTGKCQLGQECPFLHVSGADKSLVRTTWVNQRIMERRNQALASVNLDPHSPTHKRSSFHRASIFAEWLLKSFGHEYLSSGSGVLDIAGGRGDISFHLQTVAGVKCTLIDPRARKCNRKQAKKLREERLDTGNSFVGKLSDHIQSNFDDKFTNSYSDLIQNASILIGMHPDQVTELIVHTALAHNKPMAIVPCCVFGHLFPNRRTPEGKPVVEFQDFVTYISGMSKIIRQDYLNFEGRNVVLWTNYTKM